jgi:co-chaperonin GroES (HSP10)
MIEPLGNMVLLEKIEVGEKTTSTGLVIAAAFVDQGPNKGKVVAIGGGEQNYKGDIIPVPEIEEGDIVFYPSHAGTDIEDVDGKKYVLITSKNLLAISR